MNRILAAAVLLACNLMAATMPSTTLSRAVDSTSGTRIYLTSTAAAVANTTGLFVDAEYMEILGVDSNSVTVRRGAQGTRPGKHAATSTVYVGPRSAFGLADPRGPCTTTEPYLPLVVISTGTVWGCTASVWTPTAPSWLTGSGGGTWGSITGTLSSQTDLNTALSAKANQNGSDTTVTLSSSGTCTFVGTLSPAITSYTDGMAVRVKLNNACAASGTLNLNGVGAKNIYDQDGTSANTNASGDFMFLTYDAALASGAGGFRKFRTPGLTQQADTGSVTVPAVSGWNWNNQGSTITYTLPTITQAMVDAVYTRCIAQRPSTATSGTARTGVITIQLPASTTVSRDGATGPTAAGTVQSPGTAADMICFQAVSLTHYAITAIAPTTWSVN